MATGPPLEPSAYTQSEIITLLVGPKKTEFKVHKDLLVAKSDYFRGCLANNFLEAQTKTVNLADESVFVVSKFIDWLYGGCLILTPASENVIRLPKIYQFADKICSEEYCNYLVNVVRAYAKTYGGCLPLHLEHLYAYGLQATFLVKLLLKMCVYRFMTEVKQRNETEENCLRIFIKSWSEHQPSLIYDFVMETSLFLKTDYADPRDGVGCEYHTHTNGSRCSAANGTTLEVHKS